MKIKRYIDADMRQVLRTVRQDQGPDAVILSTRRVEGGIEVIAAIDYDEALVRQALGPTLDTEPDAGRTERSSTPRAAHDDEPTKPPEDQLVKHARKKSAARKSAAKESADTKSMAAEEASEPVAGQPAARPARIGTNDADVVEFPQVAAEHPALNDVRAELSSLRGLLETQLSGLLWKNSARRSPLRAQVLRNFARIGLAPDVARTIVNSLEPVENLKQLWRDPLVKLAQAIPVVSDRLISEGGIAALIGPTGVGKTTTIAKIAARFAMQNGADGIALVCADAYRIGAREHLEAFANIIGVKVRAVSDSADLDAVLNELQSKKLVLIDTEGLSQRDMALSSRLAICEKAGPRIRFYLTLSAASQEAGLDETVRRFSTLPLAGAVVTKIDEAAQLGCVIGTLVRHGLPAAWLSDGQRIPDDLYPADRKKLWLINRAVACLEYGDARIDERTMAENYGQASVVNA